MTVTFDKRMTALLVIDPYNDFISEGGKLWGRLRHVAEANNCVLHMLQVLNAARHAALDVNLPNYASAVVTTDEVVSSLSAVLRQ